MKYIIYDLIQILITLLILAIVLYVGYLFYNFVMGMDIPDWLKYMLLK